MTQTEFIQRIVPTIRKNVSKYGFGVVSAIAAQACKESAYGTSELATKANNIFGLKRKLRADGSPRVPIAIGGYDKVSGEVISGNLEQVLSTFEAFSSWEDCIEGYFQFLSSSTRYDNLHGVKEPAEYLFLIVDDGYATDDSGYAQSAYNNYVLRYDLQQYDKEDNKMTLRVMLDAGHDGKRNQSPVFKSYYESEAMWKFTEYEGAYLEKHGVIVGYTRKSLNETKDVVARGKMGKGYDVLISNHSNACGDQSVNRASAICMRGYAKSSIDETSNGIGKLLVEVTKSVMGMSQASKVYSKDAGYDRNGDKVAGNDEYYGVLHGAQAVGCAALIMEHGFHTNLTCAQWLSSDANLKKLAEKEGKAILDYFGYSSEITTEVNSNPVYETVKYTVVSGDTLGKIADKFKTTVDEIMALNQFITDKNKICVGWELIIPLTSSMSAAPVYHTVNKNDGLTNLSRIAAAYGVTLNQVKLLNPQIKAPLYIIHYGDKIRIK